MVESADYDPGVWKGHDFTAARKAYDNYAGRSYNDARSNFVDPSSLVPLSLTTDSPAPLVVVADVTGSMGEWPAVMFSKLPYLEVEGKEYLGEGLEICWAAVGDANGDKYPLQVRQFTSGLPLKDELMKLVIEGKGGGQTCETYELAALYFARNVSMPEAIHRPIIIFIGDEKPYEVIPAEFAKRWSYVDDGRLLTEQVFEELKRKFSVYFIHKPYDTSAGSRLNYRDSTTESVGRAWEKLVGEDHIAELPDANRVVDVIFGILARETGRVDYFRMEIEGRQRPDQVKEVYRSLDTIHRLPARDGSSGDKSGRSILKLPSGDDGEEAKPLL